MLSYRKFAAIARVYMQHIDIKSENATKIAEILLYAAEEIFSDADKFNMYNDLYNDLRMKKISIFESKNFKKYFINAVKKEIEKIEHENKNIKIRKITNRAFFSLKEPFSQKKAMLENKSRSSNLDLILAVFDISSDEEISKMYITVKALIHKLDETSYRKLRKYARTKFGSCRISAKYFLYVLKKIEEFEENKTLFAEENKKEIKEQKKQKKHNSKIDKSKSSEIHISEADYKRYKKSEKLDKEIRYKLYFYRQKYKQELENFYLQRLSRDDLLFFLINTENLVESQSLNLRQVLKIIEYADLNPKIENPRGWLISRFMIGRGRFYFLLRKSTKQKQNEENEEKTAETIENEEKQTSSDEQEKEIKINEDFIVFAKKHNILDSLISHIEEKVSQKDKKFQDKKFLSFIANEYAESYLINHIWKNLSPEEKEKLISYAKQEIRKFAVPPSTEEELKKTFKSIIAAKIRNDYI